MARSDFRFFHPLRVRWAEVDLQNVVFNGHYLTYFDVAFTEYWRALGLPGALAQQKTGFEMFARKSMIEYHAPAGFDDELEIGVRCARLGRSSVQFLLEIFRGEDWLISGELVYVYADTTIRKGAPLPDAWRDTIMKFEVVRPAT
jgi:acyl-CoA thioester hydrolase